MRDTNGKLEDYTILSTLGCGAKSVVYRALWHTTSREVSLKLEPTGEHNQLLNEAYILTSLAGAPGVPKLLSCGTTLDDTQYYSSTNILGMILFCG